MPGVLSIRAIASYVGPVYRNSLWSIREFLWNWISTKTAKGSVFYEEDTENEVEGSRRL